MLKNTLTRSIIRAPAITKPITFLNFSICKREKYPPKITPINPNIIEFSELKSNKAVLLS